MRKTKETKCCRITHVRYVSTIDKNLTIMRDTSVLHCNTYIGFMYMIRSEEDKVVQKGEGCTSVVKQV